MGLLAHLNKLLQVFKEERTEMIHGTSRNNPNKVNVIQSRSSMLRRVGSLILLIVLQKTLAGVLGVIR